MERPRGLVLTRDIGETIILNDLIQITITDVIKSNTVRISIDAPKEIKIDRSELYKDHVEMKKIEKDLSKRSHHEPCRHRSNKIRSGFGKYSFYRITAVPTYFLRYALAQEYLRRSDMDQEFIANIKDEINNRKNPSEGLKNGKGNRIIQ